MSRRSDDGAAAPGRLLLVAPVVSLVCLYSVVWLVAIMVGGIIAGLEPIALTSGSMEPGAARGDVVLIDETDGRDLPPGTVITFRDPVNPGGQVTHRIDDVLPDGRYRTKGDANRGPDSTPVPPEDVVGVGRLLVPLVALPVVWATSGEYHLLALLLGVGVLAVAGARVPPDEPTARPEGVRRRPRREARLTVGRAAPRNAPYPVWSARSSVVSDRPRPRADERFPSPEVRSPVTPEVRPESTEVRRRRPPLAVRRVRSAGRQEIAVSVPTPDLSHGVWHAHRVPVRGSVGRLRAVLQVLVVVVVSVGVLVAPVQRAAAVMGSSATTAGSWTAATVAAPTGVAATASCSLLLLGPQVTVTWQAVSGADGYRVGRSTTSGGPYTTVGTVGGDVTSFTDTGVSGDQTYHYVVYTTAGEWVSHASTEASVTTPTCL